MRIEKDILGEKSLEDSVPYGINTSRALDNFRLNNKKVDLSLIHAIVTVKKASANTYKKLKIDVEKYQAIIQACDELLTGKYDEYFITESLQGGAGTSTNMNVNEVIANVSQNILGYPYGSYDAVHPLDDVNRGQSTNDVYPTALRIASIYKLRLLSDECSKLQTALQEKENLFQYVKKVGRTELMDAVPITLGAEFGAYAQAIARDRWRIYKVEERLRQVNIGGTAVGLSDNASRKYKFNVVEELRNLTGIGLANAEYPMDITQNNDVFVEVSGLLKALAINLMKISNDLRLMNSQAFGEISLEPVQQGSTIMPAKVNPVIPEMTMQVSMKVISNDMAITLASERGEFELNAFLPLIADSLLESLSILKEAVYLFRTKCVEVLKCNPDRCSKHLEDSSSFGVKYLQSLGYDVVSKVIKENTSQDAKKILDSLL